jgi:hypothetical protein
MVQRLVLTGVEVELLLDQLLNQRVLLLLLRLLLQRVFIFLPLGVVRAYEIVAP